MILTLTLHLIIKSSRFLIKFWKKIGSNPIVLVLHPLTGNSDVAGVDGWWKKLFILVDQ